MDILSPSSVVSVDAVGSRPKQARPLHRLLTQASLFALGCVAYQAPVVQKSIDSFQVFSRQASHLASIKDAPVPVSSAVTWMEPSPQNYTYLQKQIKPHASGAFKQYVAISLDEVRSGYMFVGASPELIASHQNRRALLETWLQQVAQVSPKEWTGNLEIQLLSKHPWAEINNTITGGRLYQASGQPATKNWVTPQSSISLDDARRQLAEVALDAGVAGLKVPREIYESPAHLAGFAEKVAQSNAELKAVTGFEGKALGLNGRVVLDLSPSYSGGRTYTDEKGYIHIQASWTSLAHEWFHAFDYSRASRHTTFTARQSLSAQVDLSRPNSNGPAQAHSWLWKKLHTPQLSDEQRLHIHKEATLARSLNSMDPLFAAVEKGNQHAKEHAPQEGSPWIYWRQHAAAHLTDKQDGEPLQDYLLSPTEIFAFSFQAHASSIKKHSVFFDNDPVMIHNPSYVPTKIEVDSQRQTWNEFFAQNNSWWQEDTMVRQVRSSPTLRR